jgi:hypothetical protein
MNQTMFNHQAFCTLRHIFEEHPWVHYVKRYSMQTVTVDTFFKRNNLDASQYSFWNFDIQGAELLALKGAEESLKFASALTLEVNGKELYQNCALIGEVDRFLLERGFSRCAHPDDKPRLGRRALYQVFLRD